MKSTVGSAIISYLIRDETVYFNDSFGNRVDLPTHRVVKFRELSTYQYEEWVAQSQKHRNWLRIDLTSKINRMTIPQARTFNEKLTRALENYKKGDYGVVL